MYCTLMVTRGLTIVQNIGRKHPFEAVRGCTRIIGPDGHFDILGSFTPGPDDFLRDHRTYAQGCTRNYITLDQLFWLLTKRKM